MGRPKGSTDVKKRKRKVILTGIKERDLIKDYTNGMMPSAIYEKYGITKSTLKTLKKRRNVVSKICTNHVSLWKTISDFKRYKNISGVYAIYFKWKYDKDNIDRYKLVNDIKVYIGSSMSMGDRLSAHQNELKNNKHYNKNLQNIYNNSEYSVYYAVIEECGADMVMQKEVEYLNKWCVSSLLNTWRSVNEDHVRPWLEKALTTDSYSKKFMWSKDKFYNGSACKETSSIHKSGYGRTEVVVDGLKKTLIKHRIAYWEKYGEYPELIRHLCDNKRCYNADHLAKGTHRDNMLDRRGHFPEKFKEIWLKYHGDLYKISQYFEKAGRWSPNQNWDGCKVSYSVYDWEKKLDLRNKYPKVSQNRISKLRKKQAQKIKGVV